MSNTNCLEGIKCPSCGQEDSFQVIATTVFTLSDEGTGDHTDVEYDDDSPMYCTECPFEGNVSDFKAD